MNLTTIIKGDLTSEKHWAYTLIKNIRCSSNQILNRNMVFPYSYVNTEPTLLSGQDQELVNKLKSLPTYCAISLDVIKGSRDLTATLYSSNLKEPYSKVLPIQSQALDNPIQDLIDIHTTGILKEEKKDDGRLSQEHIDLLSQVKEAQTDEEAIKLMAQVYPDKNIKTLKGAKVFATRMINENS